MCLYSTTIPIKSENHSYVYLFIQLSSVHWVSSMCWKSPSFCGNNSERNQTGFVPSWGLRKIECNHIFTNKQKIAPVKNTTREMSKVLEELVVNLIQSGRLGKCSPRKQNERCKQWLDIKQGKGLGTENVFRLKEYWWLWNWRKTMALEESTGRTGCGVRFGMEGAARLLGAL